MECRCESVLCPVGEVEIRPKDKGLGSDRGEIAEAGRQAELLCPGCGDPMTVL